MHEDTIKIRSLSVFRRGWSSLVTGEVERSNAKDIQVLVGVVTVSVHRQWNSGETLVDIGGVIASLDRRCVEHDTTVK